MLVYSNGNVSEILNSAPVLDKQATIAFIRELFPDTEPTPLKSGDLSFTSPPDNEIHAGVFNGTFIVAASDFAIDHPSKLPPKFITGKYGNTIQLHAMHSVVDWFAFAVWEHSKLQRALSLSPDSGIHEDIGQKYNFEVPYWEGQHPAIDPEDEEEGFEYPFEFHPLELAEEALKRMYGYQLEGDIDSSMFEPENIPLLVFKRKKSKAWWKFW